MELEEVQQQLLITNQKFEETVEEVERITKEQNEKVTKEHQEQIDQLEKKITELNLELECLNNTKDQLKTDFESQIDQFKKETESINIVLKEEVWEYQDRINELES